MRPHVGVWALVLCLACLVGSASFTRVVSGQRGAQPTSPDLASLQGDFPSHDWPIWQAERRGLAFKAAMRRLSQDPASLEAIDAFIEADRIDDAFGVLAVIVERVPSRMAEGFDRISSNGFTYLNDGTRNYRARLHDLAIKARARSSELPREQAAHLARRMIDVDGPVSTPRGTERADALRAFIDEFAGTQEALLSQVDLMGAARFSSRAPRDAGPQYLMDLDAFIRDHPRTVAAAKALHAKAGLFQNNYTGLLSEPAGSDPTDRFFKVLAIVDELESGAYPTCQWVKDAPALVINFSSYRPTYAPGNADRLLEAYQRFVETHFRVDEFAPLSNGIGYVIRTKMAELYKAKGDSTDGVQQTFARLEKAVPDPSGVRYLEALYDAGAGGDRANDRSALVQRSNDKLLAISKRAGDPYAPEALAALASQQFDNRDFTGAIESYQAYLRAYPQSGWAWVARIRLGQAQSELGDWRSARATFRAFAQNDDPPMARVIGNTFAGRASETLGEFDVALNDYGQARAAWDPDFATQRYEGPVYVFPTPRPASLVAPNEFVSTDIARTDLTDRIDELKQTLLLPGGNLVARGRWQLRAQKWDDARASFEEMLARYPRSSLLPEARGLVHRARLERAMALADVESPTADEAAAAKELEMLSHEPTDAAVIDASIARAALLWTQNSGAEAQTVMRDALSAWRAQQPISAPPAKGSVEEDVIAIRDVVFRPTGGGVYGSGGWNAFSFPSTPPPFLVMNPTVIVRLPSGEWTRVQINRPVAGLDNVLFFDADQMRFFVTMLARLGGTRKRQPTGVMETPNQPIGPSVNILALLNQFFPARAGHWGGWEFETYPRINRLHFLDAKRTMAAADMTIGYSGATVVLEKRDGVWIAIRMTNQWIT